MERSEQKWLSKSGSKEKEQSSLSQSVERMESVIELLLETLKDLSDEEFKRLNEELTHNSHLYFRDCLLFQRFREISPNKMLLKTADVQCTVFLMVQTYGQQSVEKISGVLERMTRTDLVGKLSACSSIPKKKHSVDKHLTAAIHKVALMAAVKELLLETLGDLRGQHNFKWFLKFVVFQRSLPQIPWRRLKLANGADRLVDVMVETFGQQSVEVTKEVLMEMKESALVQRLSEIISGPEAAGSSAEVFGMSTRNRAKYSLEEHWPALKKKVDTMASVTKVLLETLTDLTYFWDCDNFKEKLLRQIFSSKQLLYIPLKLLDTESGTDMEAIAFLMVQAYGQQSVETVKGILTEMKKTNLVQMMSDSSSGSTKKHSTHEPPPPLIQTVATMAAVQEFLLESLNKLSDEELDKFKESLQLIVTQRDIPDFAWMLSWRFTRAKIANEMVQTLGMQSVELTREVLMDMRLPDLVKLFPIPKSEHKEKLPVDEHRPRERTDAKAAEKKILLETLSGLRDMELEKFKLLLQFTYFKESLPQNPVRRLDWVKGADELVDYIVTNQQPVAMTREVLLEMNRTDLVKMLPETRKELQGPSTSVEFKGFRSFMGSSDWFEVEPEVSSADGAEPPIYSLHSGAGSFECSVSGLRWVCKEKVSLKYQFRSFEEPMKRMERMGYMPAGPLMDIKVTSGKLDEVYLPHWIRIDSNPTIKDHFAVLHIDDCGDDVEQVSEVTSSHIKLSEPNFSLFMALVKIIWGPVDINCKVLIYKTNTAFLTLHVYLIPCDPGLQQELDKTQLSDGFQKIKKPHPEAALRLNDHFILTADLEGAEIVPENLMLRYNRDPNYFEVYIKNPDIDFQLMLRPENGSQPVWTRTIRQDEYQSSALTQDEHFVDKHREQLIQRVSNIGPILDELLQKNVIQEESYVSIRALRSTQEKMRELYSGPLRAAPACKDIFFKILEAKEPRLIAGLQGGR